MASVNDIFNNKMNFNFVNIFASTIMKSRIDFPLERHLFGKQYLFRKNISLVPRSFQLNSVPSNHFNEKNVFSLFSIEVKGYVSEVFI